MRLLLLSAVLPSIAHAACPSTLDDLAADLDAAEQVYASAVLVDGDARAVASFLDVAGRAHADLLCVDAVVPPALAARWHQVAGLVRFAREDLDGAARAFAGARQADATVPFGEGYLQAGEPEVELFWRDDATNTTWTSLPWSEQTRFLVNGRPEARRPVVFPVILQEVDAQGALVRTMVVEGEQDVVVTVTLPAPTPTPAPTPKPRKPAGAIALLGASAVAVGAGAGLLGYSLWAYDRQCDADGCLGAVQGDTTLSPEQVVGRIRGGLGGGAALLGVGIAGLAGSGVWLRGAPDGVAVGFVVPL